MVKSSLPSLFLTLLLLGCTQQSSGTVPTAPAVSGSEDKILFTNITPHYADSILLHASRAGIVRKVRALWKRDASFPRYSRSLANLAQWASKFGGKPLSFSSIAEVSTHWGITTPWIIQNYLVTKGHAESYLVTWIAEQLTLHQKTHSISHFGFFVKKHGGERLLVLMMQKRLLDLAPFTKWVPTGTPAVLFGKSTVRLDGLEVLITRPDQKIARRFVDLFPDQTFKLGLKFCEKSKDAGLYEAEFIGYSSDGPLSLARFSLACGKKHWPAMPEPRFITRVVPPTTEEFEQALMVQVNRYRVRQGFLPVAGHEGLHKAAFAHASEMCQKQKLMHISKSSGNPQDRLKAAKVKDYYLVAENVGSGESPSAILDGWVQSAGHRINLQLAKVTHGAVGVCRLELSDNSVVYYATLLMVNFRKKTGKTQNP